MNNKENRRYRVGPIVNGVLEAWGVYVRVGADKWKRIAVLGTQADAVEYADSLETAEAKDGKTEPENQGMNNDNINEIVGRYLAENPETAKRLVEAATKFEAEKKRRREAFARKMECAAAVKELDEAICVASDAVNKLKGDILRLQKERKVAVAELEKAAGACSAFGI